MRRLTFLLLLAATVFAAPSAGAEMGPTVDVVSNATIVMRASGGAFTNFEFVLHNCPEGSPITIVWEAQQPDKNDTSAGEDLQFAGPDNTERLILTTFGAFSPGYRWVGSGTVTCGSVVIPVSGAGSTKIVS